MSDTSPGLDIPSPDGEVNKINTAYEVGQDNYQGRLGPLMFDVHNPVFLISSLTVVAFVLVTLIFQDQASGVFGWIFTFVTTKFDWFFLGAANIFIVFCLGIAHLAARAGAARRVRCETGLHLHELVRDALRRRHGHRADVLRRARAGLSHAGLAPLGLTGPFTDGTLDESQMANARAHGLAASIFHYGLHPWAVYAVVALALSLFTYNKQLPLSLRSAFYTLLGDRVWGWPGHCIDIIAVFATLFGLTTSLGLGAQQATAGMHYVYGIPDTLNTQIIVIICVTGVALFSVVRGLDGGVKLLSNINMVFAFCLLLFVLLFGPTLRILQDFGVGFVTYRQGCRSALDADRP